MLSELWSDLRYRLRALTHRDDVERELDAELLFHIEREAEQYERLGVTREEALRRARLAFGGVDRVKEESRDARGTALLETLLQDLRYAFRGLRAKPGFTAGVVLTLGLGIGANAAMFGIIDRLLFRTPAYLRDADHVHRVYVSWTQDGSERTERNLEFARYLDFMRLTHAFSVFAAFQTRSLAVGEGEDARERPVTVASASYFHFFDVRPVLGRFYTAQEDSVPVGSPVVVLGYAYWQSQFGGQPDVLGRQLRVGRTLCTIIGVAPEHFTGMADQGVPAAYMPITAFAWGVRGRDYSKIYTWSWLEMIARRKPGVSLAAANADLAAAYRRSWLDEAELGRTPDITASRPRAQLGPVQLGRGPQGGRDARIVTWISGVALIVLLIACANVANLLLSRAVKRRREIALRLALGVSRGRLIRQLLTESLALATLGGTLGLLIAKWGGASLRALFLPPDAPTAVITDRRTLVVALLVTVGAALLTGLLPALQALRGDLARALAAGGRDAGSQPSRARMSLLLFQAALSMVLLVGAGLFVRSLQNVHAMRLGYDLRPVVFVAEDPRGVKLTSVEAMALEQRLVDEARTIPGVTDATPAVSVPFWSNEGRGLSVPGVDSVNLRGRFLLQAGAPDYFRTVGTRIVRGRAFDRRDVANGPPVVVVSEGMARALWRGADPLGKCIRIGADTAPCTTVIGVAEDMRLRSLTDEREYTYYLPIAQYGGPAYSLFVRVAGDAADYSEIVRRRLQRLMPGASYVTAQPLRTLVDPNMRSWQFGATMFVAFGGLALTLAAIGLYSVIAYGVAQRQQELGVRIALGASRAHVVRLVMGSGVRLVVAGVLIGTAIALWAGRWLAALLFQQSPRDPAIYAVGAATLLGVAVAATVVPALGASRVDPNVALRAE
jgi:putative ABC transport system permease protein